jgi:hypothetical protein
MTDQEHVAALYALRDQLYCNCAIYHERVTLLIKFISFSIGDTQVSFEAEIIKPLHANHALQNNLYKYMLAKKAISFSCRYNWPGDPYSPFILWLDPELVAYVSKHNDDVTKLVAGKILYGEDWQDLINATGAEGIE